MPSLGVVHSKEGDTTAAVVSTTSVSSKPEGAGIRGMKHFTGRLASLACDDGEGKERDAAEENENTSSTSKGQEGGVAMGQGNGYV